MKITPIVATLASLGSAAAYQDVRKNFNGHKVVHLQAEHITEEVRGLLSELDADHIGLHEDGFAIKIVPEGLRRLEEAGVPHKDGTEHWINRFQKNFDNENLFCKESAKECASKEFQDFYSTYQSLDALHARVEAATAGLDFAETSVLAQSFEGRDMQLTEIGDSSNPLAFFACNAHAREWLTPHYCAHMVEALVADGGHPLLETFSFAIVTSANPDGYEFSRTDNNLWRKTRKPNEDSTCIGTDPNRNYDDHFCGDGTSDDPCSDVYCGITAFDQNETAAIAAYGIEHQDRIIAWTDFHSYGSYWLSPLGYSTDLPPAEDFGKMSECMSRVQRAIQATSGETFTIGGAGAVLYAAAGASDDWFYLQQNVTFSFTAEMRGDSFQPDPSNIILSNEEIFVGMVAQMECVADLELEISSPTFPPVAAPSAAPGWTCSPDYYGGGDGCDCECGVHDPDCDDPEEVVFNCALDQMCVEGSCFTDPSLTVSPVPTPTAQTPTASGGESNSGGASVDSSVYMYAIVALVVVLVALIVAIVAVSVTKKPQSSAEEVEMKEAAQETEVKQASIPGAEAEEKVSL